MGRYVKFFCKDPGPEVFSNSNGGAEVWSNASTGDGGGGGGYGGGGYGSGGGGGSGSPTTDAAKNLAAIVAFNQDTITQKVDNADRIYDEADKANQRLRGFQEANAERGAGADWYKQYSKLASAYANQRDTMGNAAYGSGLQGLNEITEVVDDLQDSTTLDAFEETLGDIDSDYYKAIIASNNGRNELYMDSEADLRELVADYAAQMNNMGAKYVNGEEEGFDKIIDAENRQLNPPDWLKAYENFFNNRFKEAVETPLRKNTRGATAHESSRNVNRQQSTRQTSQSANKDYWQRISKGYENRM